LNQPLVPRRDTPSGHIEVIHLLDPKIFNFRRVWTWIFCPPRSWAITPLQGGGFFFKHKEDFPRILIYLRSTSAHSPTTRRMEIFARRFQINLFSP
jgi:hypothetical protein